MVSRNNREEARRDFTQGYTEFENQVKLIAHVQHCYLTKFLGYYINGVEKFLVYEFMTNNSLGKVIINMTS